MENINQRKLDHIRLVAEDETLDRRGNGFERIHLTHRAMPERALEQVDPSVQFLGKKLSFPLLISSMTGGVGPELKRINRNLAEAAEAENVALAVGSQRVIFSDTTARESFALRRYAPTTVLLGNLGAVQLNGGMGDVECEAALQVLGADGLFIHLNPLQEAVQPEGTTDFSNLRERIAEVVKTLSKPVLVKEVGAGLSPQDVKLLMSAGVQYIDVAGRGGTSWSLVESRRCSDPSLGELFADWGIPTPVALRLLAPYRKEVRLIASGGVRNGIDMVKCMVLGASICGFARPFLAPARESAAAVRVMIRRIKREFVTALFLLGASCPNDIIGNQELILYEDRD